MMERRAAYSQLGMRSIHYMIKHEYIRGWEVAEERGVDYVANNFLDIIDSFDRFINSVTGRFNATDLALREAIWIGFDNNLAGRSQLAQRAVDNITEAYVSYKNGTQLVNYHLTGNQTYDSSFVNQYTLSSGSRGAIDECYQDYLRETNNFMEAIEELREAGKTFVIENKIDETKLKITRDKLISAGKGYNYRHFLFRSRIITAPLQLIEEKKEEFERLWDDFIKAIDEQVLIVLDNELRAWDVYNTRWQLLKNVLLYSKMYLTDRNRRKIDLARYVDHPSITEALTTMGLLFRDVQANSRIQKESWPHLQECYYKLWNVMLGEQTLQKYYILVNDDFATFSGGNDQNKHRLARIWYNLLKNQERPISPVESYKDVLALNEDILERRLNADMAQMDINRVIGETNWKFYNYLIQTNLAWILADKGQQYLDAVDTWMGSLKHFEQGSHIDANFIK